MSADQPRPSEQCHTPGCDWPADHMGACPERPDEGRCIGCRHPSGSACGGCGAFVNDGWNGQIACFCGQPNDRERVHRAHACDPWVSREPAGNDGSHAHG